MSLVPYILEQALRQLRVPEEAIRQFQIASALSDVDGKGFPRELFQLSAPMITRGLLNFAVLQMKRDWLYPHWVRKQLDPKSDSFINRSQNPLMINMTHRNWTMIGSPHGFHEAIVDPCGMLTPLPREWSVDVWIATKEGNLFPSMSQNIRQEYDREAPRVITTIIFGDLILEIESFTGTTRSGLDVVFNKAAVRNTGTAPQHGWLFAAVRPFNPEGVAPVRSIEFRTKRHCYVNGSIGIVFSKEADLLHCSNTEEGDSAKLVQSIAETSSIPAPARQEVKCRMGLANGFAGFAFTAAPAETFSVSYSTALDTDRNLKLSGDKLSWRVSYDNRLVQHRRSWMQERSIGTQILLPNANLQGILEANILTLLQLHDKNFVSPGPYLYHHFWFRDAAPILHALDRFGYHKRVRQSIHTFAEKMTGDGFFKGPDGEWDSNGEALWLIEKHFQLSPSLLWLKNFYPVIRKAAQWIIKKRSESIDSLATHSGLMPKSLSAEHFGTTDQYYWDSFWSLAGLHAAARLASHAGKENDKEFFISQASLFERDIKHSLQKAAERLGAEVIPASPFRPFDEGAVGSLAGVYPLQIHALAERQFANTLKAFDARFVDENGYYHPLIHSGYNPYLTLHIAHSYLLIGEIRRAWEIAGTVFRRCIPPYSLPEAIHPKTGGGSMGDGHHGWAAAEIVLFLLDVIIHEDAASIHLFEWCTDSFWTPGLPLDLHALVSTIGPIDVRVEYEHTNLVWCTLNTPEAQKEIVLHFPFAAQRITSSVVDRLLEVRLEGKNSTARCRSGYFTLKIEL
ncbi:MAG: hypothetical protein WAV76_05070 [Bacteroidota bacterium]